MHKSFELNSFIYLEYNLSFFYHLYNIKIFPSIYFWTKNWFLSIGENTISYNTPFNYTLLFLVFVCAKKVQLFISSRKSWRNMSVKSTYQQLWHNIGYQKEIISTKLMLEMKICQAIDNIHLVTHIIYTIYCIIVFPSLLHDSMQHLEQI